MITKQKEKMIWNFSEMITIESNITEFVCVVSENASKVSGLPCLSVKIRRESHIRTTMNGKNIKNNGLGSVFSALQQRQATHLDGRSCYLPMQLREYPNPYLMKRIFK